MVYFRDPTPVLAGKTTHLVGDDCGGKDAKDSRPGRWRSDPLRQVEGA